MAEASIYERAFNNSGPNSKKTIKDICKILERLQDGQGRFEKQMEDVTCTLRMLLNVQQRMIAHAAAPIGQSTGVADAESRTILNRRYPQFDGGRRLTETFELLEMILLELPSREILFAQYVNKQFHSTIVRSRLLQLRLFLTVDPSTSMPKNVNLNPILTDKSILPHIPIYFDEERRKLAYCHRENRRRVYCTTATSVKDDITGRDWVHLKFTNLCPFTWFEEARYSPFGAGSWKQMCLSQPSCDIQWHLVIVEGNREHRYSGIIEGRSTMDTLLDALAVAEVVDEGEHRHRSNRR